MRFLCVLACAGMAFSAPLPRVKIWVELRDKGPSVGGRRDASQRMSLAWEDAPVYAPYLSALRQAGFTPDVALKWQNRVSGWVDSAHVRDIRRLPMVARVENMPRRAPSFQP